MLFSIFKIIFGLALLVYGGDELVEGASAIARRFRLSPMVIGLTIVAFGTSAPELIVSIQAALGGNPGIALGNVVGSNIANIALILGVTALIRPIPVQGATIKIDTPYLVFASVALTALSYFVGALNRIEGIVGLILLFLFIGYQIRSSKKTIANAEEAKEAKETIAEANTGVNAENSAKQPAMWKSIIALILGISFLKFGAEMLVGGAVNIASSLGVDDRIIGVTVVAIGTSLPELFASVMAARKGNVDLAVGNVVGSNLFNIMCVLATATAISPIADVGEGFTPDCLWMLALTLLIWFQLRTDYRLTRLEGAVLLCTYAVFIALTII